MQRSVLLLATSRPDRRVSLASSHSLLETSGRAHLQPEAVEALELPEFPELLERPTEPLALLAEADNPVVEDTTQPSIGQANPS